MGVGALKELSLPGSVTDHLCGSPQALTTEADAVCWTCERDCDEHDWIEALGHFICPVCIERHLDASTFDARCEVGLVGGGH